MQWSLKSQVKGTLRVLCTFSNRSMDITFVPCFLKPMEDFSVNAAGEEVEALEVEINQRLDAENSRILRELRIFEDHVSV